MTKSGKIWEKPQLIILSRDTSEENVLLACKKKNKTGPAKTKCQFCKTAGTS